MCKLFRNTCAGSLALQLIGRRQMAGDRQEGKAGDRQEQEQEQEKEQKQVVDGGWWARTQRLHRRDGHRYCPLVVRGVRHA